MGFILRNTILRCLRDYSAFGSLWRILDGFPSMCQLTITCNFSSRGTNNIFWPLAPTGTHITHIHAGKHIHIKEKVFKMYHCEACCLSSVFKFINFFLFLLFHFLSILFAFMSQSLMISSCL